MSKSKEELNKLKQEYKTLTSKLSELSKDELEHVVGGFEFVVENSEKNYENRIYDDNVVDEEFNRKF